MRIAILLSVLASLSTFHDGRAADAPASAASPRDDASAAPSLEFDEAAAKQGAYIIVGSVIRADDKTPLSDVVMTVSTGIGTLRPTATTKTDDKGRFRLEFRSGSGMAIVHAQKKEWHAWTYGWPAQFVLSAEPLEKGEIPPRTDNLTPGQPSRLEFRMQPAASLTVTLLDADGRPMPDHRLWLTGENLPPGASVIKDGRTDADGKFTVTEVPRSRYRVVLIGDENQGELELGSIHFRDAAEYHATATIHEWTADETHRSLKVSREPNR